MADEWAVMTVDERVAMSAVMMVDERVVQLAGTTVDETAEQTADSSADSMIMHLETSTADSSDNSRADWKVVALVASMAVQMVVERAVQ